MASVDVITLDNFAEKLPQWHHDDPSHLHALVDMGSNGIRFSISDLSPPATRLLPCAYRERAAISLFDALQPTGDASSALVLPPTTIALVATTLARFRHIAIDEYGVRPERIAVLATEAMRRAANAQVLLDAISEAAPGLSVFVLAPEVETLFGAMGARASMPAPSSSDDDESNHGALMLDLGGGSVQLTYVDPRQGPGYEVAAARAGQSLPYGAARLTRMVGGSEGAVDKASETRQTRGITLETARVRAVADAEATAAAVPHLIDDLASALTRLQTQCPGLRAQTAEARPIDVYLCGGGFRGYGSMLMHANAVQPYPIALVHGYAVPGSVFADTTTALAHHHLAGHGKIFGLSKRRRRQFAAIATVVQGLVAALRLTMPPTTATTTHCIGTVTFCAGGNREGALLMRLPPTLREADPLAVLAVSEARSVGMVDGTVLHAVADALASALPLAKGGCLRSLLPLVAARIWTRIGTDSEANAACALHDAVTRDPATPGLTHRGRALLAISLWARWGGGVSPADAALLAGLRAVLKQTQTLSAPDDLYWAEYIGGVATVLALVFPAPPRSAADVGAVRFRSVIIAKNKTVVHLDIAITAAHTVGLDVPAAIADCFGVTGNEHKKHVKLELSTTLLSHS